MKLTLIRVEESSECTRGVLLFDGVIRFVTLEPPWRNNERNVSRIPAGCYVCVRDNTGKIQPTFEISNVPGRSEIEFHGGVNVRHTQGCVLLGFVYSMVAPMITPGAPKPLIRFMELLKGVEQFPIRIIDPP